MGCRAGRLWPVLVMLLAAAAACQRAGGPGGRGALGQTPTTATLLPPAPPAVVGSPTPTPRPLPVVSGDIFYRERIVLPSDATVRVRVVRLGPRGAPRPVIAELAFPPPRRVPIPFSLSCDPDALEPGAEYGLEASIARRGKVALATVEPVPVLAGGRPSPGLKVLVRRTR
jgi:putative lipoprotein